MKYITKSKIKNSGLVITKYYKKSKKMLNKIDKEKLK